MIIPSIDIMDGKAVQLVQGKRKIIEREDVLDLAREFRKYGEIAVIDLDAAMGKGDNLGLIKRICRIADCRVGGGIRTVEKARELLRCGARKIIIGTMANNKFLVNIPKDKVIVAVDTDKDFIVDKGWTRKLNKKPEERIKELDKYCNEFLFTDVNVEGTMKGINLDKIKIIKSLTKNKITVAGGIKSIKEIETIENLGMNAQIGMALYKNRIKPDKTFIELIDFKNKLVPTIVQDTNKEVLMLAYSTKESLAKSFITEKATYYSRSRKRLWTKGEESGNYQELIKARYDCDRDTILFTVKQKNVACHTGRYSCFEDEDFEIEVLYKVIKERIKNPSKESYTSKISKSEKKLKEKIIEEANELVNYTDKQNLIWEAADLTYFVLILLAKKNIPLNYITDELRGRQR